MAIATRDQIKALLGITDSSKDTIIDAWIPAVDRQIERHTRRAFNKVTGIVERHNGRDSRFLYPKRTPILLVSDLKIIDPTDGSTVEQFTSADFEVKGSGQFSTGEFIEMIQRLGFGNVVDHSDIRFRAGTNNVEVTYDAGFETIDMPPDVQAAMAMQLNTYISSSTRPNGMESERISKYTYKRGTGGGTKGTTRSGLIPEVKEMLASFIRPLINYAGEPTRGHHVRHLRT